MDDPTLRFVKAFILAPIAAFLFWALLGAIFGDALDQTRRPRLAFGLWFGAPLLWMFVAMWAFWTEP
jgi:hypothetical protein